MLYLGCTKARHDQIGIHAVINARGGLQSLNEPAIQDTELQRDARGIRGYQQQRIRWYGPSSKFFRRHRAKIAHLISSYND